ncbi:MAG: hypothetical protein JNK14_01525 [Chitinophagaceae bacterium]|nr:hypothetical protein [Chitinophagaceae bacterium]
MKKFVSLSFFSLLMLVSFAQSEKYVKAMEKLVPSIDTLWNADQLKDLSNSFERIADAEKTQWLPYYYAALARVNAGYAIMMTGATGADKTDPEGNKAQELITKAEALSQNNSEIFIVKKLIATLMMIGDPMNRYMTYGPAAGEALETAKKLNPENPRVYLQEGADKINTPEQYGGNKEEGKKLIEEAMKKFESFKPESAIHPNWGRGQAQYYLSK